MIIADSLHRGPLDESLMWFFGSFHSLKYLSLPYYVDGADCVTPLGAPLNNTENNSE